MIFGAMYFPVEANNWILVSFSEVNLHGLERVEKGFK